MLDRLRMIADRRDLYLGDQSALGSLRLLSRILQCEDP